MPSTSVQVLVIGAGPTGIGAAVRLRELGTDHLVVDAEHSPGGMARSVRDHRGFTWDLGGHVIHSHFDTFDKAMAASGVPMRGVRRNGAVWMDGELKPTPIQQHLAELPADARPDAPAANLAEYYRNNFGADLAGRFFEPHAGKMWAHPLERVGHEWTSLRGGSQQRNVPALGLAADRPPAVDEFFPYPEGGTGRLWRGIYETSTDQDRFRFGTRVVALDLRGRTVTLDDGTTIEYEACVSTAPITTTAGWTRSTAAHDVTGLASSRVYAIGFGFAGPPPATLADKTYLYSPEADVPWYRATMLSNYDPAMAGPGRWNVLCEVSTSATRPIRMSDAVDRARRSLAALDVDLSTLVSVWTTVVPMGYPVPTLGRDEVLRRIDESLREHGVFSRGRFGGWRYESCNQDYSFAQGVEAVQHITDGTPEQVYWHPERF